MPSMISRSLLIAVLLYLLPAVMLGAGKLDSLVQTLPGMPPDTLRVLRLAKLASNLRYSHPDSAFQYAVEALELAESLDYKAGQAKVLGTMGGIYGIKGNYPAQLEMYLTAIPIYEALQDLRGLSGSLNGIGNVYFSTKVYEKALDYYEQSLAIRRKINYQRGVAGSLNNIANIYKNRKEYDKAMDYYRQALKVNREINFKSWEAINLNNIGLVYHNLDSFPQALDYLEQGLKIRQEINNRSGESSSLYNIGLVHKRMGNCSKAEEYYLRALALAEDMNALNRQEEILNGLGGCYEIMGQPEKALEFYHRHERVRDSLFGTETSTRLADLHAGFELEKIEKEMALREQNRNLIQEAALSRQKLINTWIVIGLVLVLIVVGVLLYLYRMNKKANEVLEQRVAERTRELNTFIYQSSHDLRSPLTSIQGLLKIAITGVVDQETLDYLKLVERKVNSLESINRKLIRTMELKNDPVDFKKVDVKEELGETLDRVRELPGSKEVEIRQELMGLNGFRTDVAAFKTILEDLISNSIFYRDNTKPSYCAVKLQGKGEGLHLEVEDNGVGIPEQAQPHLFEMFYRANVNSPGSGLGLYNVKIAVEKLNGEIRLKSRPGQGTTVVVDLPGVPG